jgi:hypothetical protein
MKFKYPKLVSFLAVIIIAYFIFKSPMIAGFILHLNSLSNLGAFIAGFFYSFGFTSPLSAGFFLTLKTETIIFTGVIGGIGAMLADLFIFRFVKISFKDEFEKLKKEKMFRKIGAFARKRFKKSFRTAASYVIAGILIGSPLPDEAGITILAGLSKIKENVIIGISFVLNTIGIILLILIGN